ncbi:MAG TPA: hypothetical protein DCO79_09335, partial [Spirochaeta sp.]|nr:hypothetical protein [Spirochaeta sp.]
MKLKILFMITLLLFCSISIYAQENGIHSLKIQEIIELYREPIEELRKLEPAEKVESLSDNRLRINYLGRHISALKHKTEADVSAHLKLIYKDSIITLYEELDKLQTTIITDNIKSIDELSIYLARFKNKKKSQDELIDDMGLRVENLRAVLNDLSSTFDSYDQIIEKQNKLIDSALDLNIEAYKNTIFLLPGLGVAENLTPYISLGLGFMTNARRFSYGGMIEAGFSPTQ